MREKKKETKIQKSHTKMQIEKSITQMKIIKKKNWTFASKKTKRNKSSK